MIKRVAAFFLLLYAGLWCLQQVPSRAAGWLPLAKVSGGGGNVTWTPTANPAFQAGTANPQQFLSVAIGTAAANRWVIFCAAENNNGTVTAADVGGVTATKAADGMVGGVGATIWYANVPSGTTATINLTSGAFPSLVGIAVGTINTATGTPNTTATEPGGGFNNDPQVTTSALTVLTNGVGVMCGATTAVNASPTFNNWNSDFSIVSGTSYQLLLGHLNSTGTPSISGFAFADFSIAAASWGP